MAEMRGIGSSRFIKISLRALIVVVLLTIIIFGLYYLLSQSYPFRWNAALNPKNIDAFNEGLLITLQVSGLAMIGGTLLGLLVALARLSPFAILRDMGMLYVQTLRNIPFLVFILFMYFGVSRVFSSGPTVPIPLIDIEVDSRIFWGVISLSLFEASFISEIFRAGIQAVHKTQIEAARSLGMSYVQAMQHVVLPQAFRMIIPPLTGELIALVKESALLMVISLEELTLTARQLVQQTPLNFEFYAILAAYYLAITLPLSFVSHLLERKLAIGKAR
jgi:polar amino acid transport system permease protein